MARVTIEDCLEKVENRFELVHLAAQRTRMILEGDSSLVDAPKNKPATIALREIAAGKVMKVESTTPRGRASRSLSRRRRRRT
jgi:DNA-directed RNA polymerase subunit omega